MTRLTESKFLTDAELKSFLTLLDKAHAAAGERQLNLRDYLMLKLTLLCGGRSIEVLRVTPRHLGEGNVFLQAAKGSTDRTIPLPPSFFKLLKTYVAGMAEDQPIFPITTRHFRRIWNAYRPNPRKGSKSLRHSGGVRLYAKTRDIKTVKTFLGHVDVRNTMIYMDFVESVGKLRSQMTGMWHEKIS